MGIRTKIEIEIAALFVAILGFAIIQTSRVRSLKDERNRYRNNTETLLTDVQMYKVRDSLSAAKVQSLELTIREFERFRAEDAAMIKSLRIRNRDLAAANKTQSQTIIELSAAPRDTVIIRDSASVPAVAVHCGDAWYDFSGILADGEFSGKLTNRDSLLIAETVKYRRFLGFLWKTRKIQDRQTDVVSKNPHTQIVGVEYIVIER